VDFTEQPAGTPVPGDRQVDDTWARADFDIVLAPEDPAEEQA
jgi:hypothetical protein